MRKKYNLNLTGVGGRLRDIRETLNITLEKMQEITGFSKSLISAAEKGLKKPSAIYLFALSDQYNVNLNYVFNGKGSMFIPGVNLNAHTGNSELDDTFGELIYMVENVKLVRYAMLTEYIKFKAQNKAIIKDILEENENEEQ